MLKFIAHDTANDVAIVQTAFGFSVRYGLEVTKCPNLEFALTRYAACVRHALHSEGLFEPETT